MTIGRLVLVLVVAIVLVGCGGRGRAPSCEAAIRAAVKIVDDGEENPGEAEVAELVAMCIREHWSAELRICISKAKTSEKLTSCMSREVESRGRRSEAELNLDAIKKSAKNHFVDEATYPVATVGLTPAQPCCRGGGVTKCPADPANWQGVEAWDMLDFEITESHFFQYSYESDGKTYVARAVGDLDCDGVTSTWELRGTSEGGNQETILIKPTRVD
jgi:hypothetical protein